MSENINRQNMAELNSSETKPQNLPRIIKVFYGTLDAPVTSVFNMIGFYLLYFLTDVVGISPAIAGSVLTLAVFWDAVSDPAMGFISDRSTIRYGRRRPYIIMAAIPYCITAWLIFTTPPLTGWMLIAYFMIMVVLLHTFQTIMYVPYTALTPEMTTNYDERTTLSTSRTFWANFGGLFGGAIPLLIVTQFSDAKVGWSAAAGIFSLIYIFPILVTWHVTRGRERGTVDTEPLRIKEVVGALVGNPSFRYISLIYLFGATGVYVSMTTLVYFLQNLIGYSEEQVSYYFIFLYVVSIVTVPIVPFLSKRIGKRMSCIVLFIAWALGFGSIALIVQPDQAWLLYLMGIFGAIGANAVYQLSWAMIPDAVEVDEYKTGKRREGMFYSVANFLLKLGTGIAVFAVGLVLEIVGYVPNEIQSASTLFGIRIITGVLLPTFVIIALFMAIAMPMTRKRHKALLEAIEAKKTGKAYDEESIKDLL